MQARCKGGAGEVQARCKGGAGEVQARCEGGAGEARLLDEGEHLDQRHAHRLLHVPGGRWKEVTAGRSNAEDTGSAVERQREDVPWSRAAEGAGCGGDRRRCAAPADVPSFDRCPRFDQPGRARAQRRAPACRWAAARIRTPAGSSCRPAAAREQRGCEGLGQSGAGVQKEQRVQRDGGVCCGGCGGCRPACGGSSPSRGHRA